MAAGDAIARPQVKEGDAAEAVSDLQQEVDELRARLLDGVPLEASDPAHAQHTRWLLAYLIDWHRREENAEWWEYFRLKEMPAEDLFDERDAIAGLSLRRACVGRCSARTAGPPDRSWIATRIRRRKWRLAARASCTHGMARRSARWWRTTGWRESSTSRRGRHGRRSIPSEVFACDVISDEGAAAVGDAAGATRPGRQAPRSNAGWRCSAARRRVCAGPPSRASADEAATDFATRIVTTLDRTVLAIQGPPGAGKTYAGARMIRALVAAGKRVGITANSHAVIRNLLTEVQSQAAKAGETVRLGAKVGDADEDAVGVREYADNEEALAAIGAEVDVLGGTAWLWSRPDAAAAVDVLFVDEAGQMSLANVLAVSQAADSVVLLGDPQQLDQPQKATHPDGVGISALEHMLGGAETMPEERGIFLPITFRMSPAITAFTSELFYDGKLQAKPGLENQVLTGTGALRRFAAVAGAGGARRQSERVGRGSGCGGAAARDSAAKGGAAPGAAGVPSWTDEHGVVRALTGHGHPRGGAVQRAGEPAEGAAGAPSGVRGRHGGQVPGADRRGHHLLDDDVAARRMRREGSSSSTA